MTPPATGMTTAVVSECPICGHPEHSDAGVATDCATTDCLCQVCPSCGGHTPDSEQAGYTTCLRCGGEGIA